MKSQFDTGKVSKYVLQGLTRKADYGLRLMLEAAAEGGYVTTRSVSERRGIPYQFLRQAAGILRAQGLLVASRGASGGVRLARPAGTISVLDVAAAFGGVALNACTAVPPRCDLRKECPAFPVWVQAQAATERALAGTSLESLLCREESRRTVKLEKIRPEPEAAAPGAARTSRR